MRSRKAWRYSRPSTAIVRRSPCPRSRPGWAGVDLGGSGYVVARVNAVLPRAEKAKDATAREQAQVAQWMSKMESDAYFEVLKRRMRVAMKVANPADAK